MSQSLESVLSGQRPRAHTVGVLREDQHGRPLPSAMIARSVMAQQDLRRFSEANLVLPPRPPLPNLKRLNIKNQRKPIVQPPSGNSWPPQMVMSPPAQQTQPPAPFHPQQGTSGSNLVKMAQMTRSTPQLDEDPKERVRDREKSHYVQNTKESLVAQVIDYFLVVYNEIFFPG